jgi:hypothetical protein
MHPFNGARRRQRQQEFRLLQEQSRNLRTEVASNEDILHLARETIQLTQQRRLSRRSKMTPVHRRIAQLETELKEAQKAIEKQASRIEELEAAERERALWASYGSHNF